MRTDDEVRAEVEELVQQATVRSMPTAGWVSLTKACPYCGTEMQSACDQARPYTNLEMAPMASAEGALRSDLFGHINTFHKAG